MVHGVAQLDDPHADPLQLGGKPVGLRLGLAQLPDASEEQGMEGSRVRGFKEFVDPLVGAPRRRGVRGLEDHLVAARFGLEPEARQALVERGASCAREGCAGKEGGS
jgi:hypothetical protein